MFFIRGENMHENDATSCEIEVCEYIHAHEETVKLVKSVMPPDEQLYDLAELYKIFGDGTRIKILYVLFQGEMCVCDISTLLGAGQSAVSHQLKILRQSDLITYRKSGKNIFYTLADDHVRDIIEKALEHIKE
jgi:ArsR family transcriptional regulator